MSPSSSGEGRSGVVKTFFRLSGKETRLVELDDANSKPGIGAMKETKSLSEKWGQISNRLRRRKKRRLERSR